LSADDRRAHKTRDLCTSFISDRNRRIPFCIESGYWMVRLRRTPKFCSLLSLKMRVPHLLGGQIPATSSEYRPPRMRDLTILSKWQMTWNLDLPEECRTVIYPEFHVSDPQRVMKCALISYDNLFSRTLNYSTLLPPDFSIWYQLIAQLRSDSELLILIQWIVSKLKIT
jgi:hypothetical protein